MGDFRGNYKLLGNALVCGSFILLTELIKSGLPGAMQLAKITHAYRAFPSFCGIKFSYNKLYNTTNWSVLTSDATKISVMNFRFAKVFKNSNLCISCKQPDTVQQKA